MNSREWQDFAAMFAREILPESFGGELLHLVGDDLALAKVIYGLFQNSSIDWIKNYKSKFLEHKTPLQCIRHRRFDLLYPFLMAATATDGEREDLKTALLRGKYFPDDPHTPSRKRALTVQILDEIADELKAGNVVN